MQQDATKEDLAAAEDTHTAGRARHGEKRQATARCRKNSAYDSTLFSVTKYFIVIVVTFILHV